MLVVSRLGNLRRPLLAALFGVLLLLPISTARADVVKGFWGVPKLGEQSAFPIYADLGVDLYQIQLRWERVAPTRPANPVDPADPAYEWPKTLDFVMQEAATYGMDVGLLVMGSPAWANGGKSWNVAPSADADYAAFLRAAATRYPAVRHWMIWGETNRTANWDLGRPSSEAQRARRYARLVDAAYPALKTVSRRNRVIGGMTFSRAAADWARWMKLPNGRPPRLDMYGHNPFSRRRPVLSSRPSVEKFVAFADLHRFRRVLDRTLRRRRIPIFVSEYTLPTGKSTAFDFQVDERTQARWVTDAFRTARRVKGVYGISWYLLQDNPDKAAIFGLLDPGGRKKPAYYAFKRG